MTVTIFPVGGSAPPPPPAPDIYAATRIVSLIPGDGTDLTIAAALAALPAAGGSIYVKQGTYPIAATLVIPDKPATGQFGSGGGGGGSGGGGGGGVGTGGTGGDGSDGIVIVEYSLGA